MVKMASSEIKSQNEPEKSQRKNSHLPPDLKLLYRFGRERGLVSSSEEQGQNDKEKATEDSENEKEVRNRT